MSTKCTLLWREVHFEVKMYEGHQVRTTFGSCDVEQVHAVVARSTFRSQHVKNTRGSDHFLEVQMSKKCTPLWREAHFEVKMLKAPGVRTTFGGSDVEKLHAVVAGSTFRSQNVQSTPGADHFWSCDVEQVHAVVARSTFRSQNVKNTRGSDHFWRFRCRFARRSREVHFKSKYKHQGFGPLLEVQCRFASLHYNTLLYTTLHSTTLHYTTLHYTTLHYTTLQYAPLHYSYNYRTTLRYTPLHYITLHNTPLHYNYTYDYTTALHYTPLDEITLHYTTLHYATLHSTTLHYTILHYTTLHYTEWHCTTDRQVDR